MTNSKKKRVQRTVIMTNYPPHGKENFDTNKQMDNKELNENEDGQGQGGEKPSPLVQASDVNFSDLNLTGESKRPLLFSEIIFNNGWGADNSNVMYTHIKTAGMDDPNNPMPSTSTASAVPSGMKNVNQYQQEMLQLERMQEQQVLLNDMMHVQDRFDAINIEENNSSDIPVNVHGAIGSQLRNRSNENSPPPRNGLYDDDNNIQIINENNEFLLFGAPNNRLAIDIMHELQQKVDDRYHNYNICGSCHGYYPAYHCFECSETLCFTCCGIHNQNKNCNLQNLKEIINPTSLSFPPRSAQYMLDYEYCNIHNVRQNYVCRVCRIIICQDCSFDEHNHHRTDCIANYVMNPLELYQQLMNEANAGKEIIKRLIDCAMNNEKKLDREMVEITRMRKQTRPQYLTILLTWCEENNVSFVDLMGKYNVKTAANIVDQQNSLRNALAGIAAVTTELKNFHKYYMTYNDYKKAKLLIEADHQINHFLNQAKAIDVSQTTFFNYICKLEQVKLENLASQSNQNMIFGLDNAQIQQMHQQMQQHIQHQMQVEAATSNASKMNSNNHHHHHHHNNNHGMKQAKNNRPITNNRTNRNGPNQPNGHYHNQRQHNNYHQGVNHYQQRQQRQHYQQQQYVSVPSLSLRLPIPNASVMANVNALNYYNAYSLETLPRNIPRMTPQASFGYDGSNIGQLSRPWGCCVDRDGNIIISDRRNNRIQVFNPDGTVRFTFGKKGSGNGEFELPAGITVDRSNRIIVCDKDNHRVQIFSSSGIFILSFGHHGRDFGEFQYPWDVATNDAGHIVVSDTRNHRIQMFSALGHFMGQFSFDTVYDHTYRANTTPRGICYTKEGDIIVTDFENHRIIKLDGYLTKIIAHTGSEGISDFDFNRPSGICCDSMGRFIVADSKNQRLAVYTTNLHFICTIDMRSTVPEFANEKDRPCDVAVLKNGNIVVVFETSPDTKDLPHANKTFVKIF